jgi:hypothetical protein
MSEELVNMAIVGGGIAFGWAASHFVVKLSTRISALFGKAVKSGDAKLTWAGWFMAVAVYLVMSFGGIGLPSVKGFSGYKGYASYFMAGMGVGGLIDEVMNIPGGLI